MKLLLDIGNTRIKWAFSEDGRLLLPGGAVHRGRLRKALDELRDAVNAALSGDVTGGGNGLSAAATDPTTAGPRLDAAVAVNVAGADTGAAVAAAVDGVCGLQPEFVQTASVCGAVRNGYTQPAQLGADRWAAIVGAWYAIRGDVCVVDAGTALTIDLVRGDGQHLGGVILPGLAMMQSSLGVETAAIAGFAAAAPGPGEPEWYGRATAEAVTRGAHFGLCAAIDRAVSRFPGGRRPVLWLTGGDAPVLSEELAAPAELRPMLVLEGLDRLLAERG